MQCAHSIGPRLFPVRTQSLSGNELHLKNLRQYFANLEIRVALQKMRFRDVVRPQGR